MSEDDDLLPAEDRCAYASCGKPRAAHTGWNNGGPSHGNFIEPKRKPNPERYVSAHIQTDWDCSQCGEHNDVWGEATEWMECGFCGGHSYLIPFMNG